MSDQFEEASLEQVVLFRPAQIRRRARHLRTRSHQCAELAGTCVTDEGKQVLEGMAVELRGEADELESALLMIRRLYAESFENDPVEPGEG